MKENNDLFEQYNLTEKEIEVKLIENKLRKMGIKHIEIKDNIIFSDFNEMDLIKILCKGVK